ELINDLCAVRDQRDALEVEVGQLEEVMGCR
ncbi:unnamed protein product, partial [marine sediment metagenome]